MGKKTIKCESQFFVKNGDGTIVPLSQEKETKIRYKKVSEWGFEEEWQRTIKPTKLSPMRGTER